MRKSSRKGLLASIGLSIILMAVSIPSASASAHSKTSKSISAVYDFKGVTLTGTNFSGAELAGKPTVLWFWTPWCPTCRAEAPNLVALEKSFKGKVTIIGVPAQAPLADMKQFVKETKTSKFAHLADTDGAIWQHFQIPYQPATIFLTPKGAIASKQIGALSKSELFKRARQLLKKP